MANQQSDDRAQQTGGPEGGRQGVRNREGGPSQDGHLSPQIDRKDPTAETEDGQIAQDRQQSSGLGSGQS